LKMRKTFELVLTVTVETTTPTELETVRRNLEILPSMVEDLGICLDGTSDTTLASIRNTLKEKGGKRGRPPKKKMVAA